MNASPRIGPLLCLYFAAIAQPAQAQSLQGHRPAAVVHLPPVGRLEMDRELKLAIGLPLRNKEALTNLLQRIYDPASPDYHHYLTPAQFADAFGPASEDYQAIQAFSLAHGLKVRATHSNRTLLDVTGSVSNIEKAFHVTLRTYEHPRAKRVFYAPDTEPSLDLATPVLHISGLDDYVQPHPMSLTKTPLAGSTGIAYASGAGPSGEYMGNDFRAAYLPGVALTGAGQTVGLLEFDGYYPSDISNYASLAGINADPLTNVYLDGFDGTPGPNNTEVALDIDMANCMAPGLSWVIVYEGEQADDILNRMATDNLANQLSSSWSYPIDWETEQIFLQFAAQGQSFFNASGDDDAWVGEIATPCDDPNVTSVGGTSLTTTGPGGPWVSETVWNWGVEFGARYNGKGSGGGISTTYPIPSWQANVSMTASQGSTIFRNIPDVALTADNIFVIANNGEELNVGGTSCATALWAGFIALANEQSAESGLPKLGFLNPALYAIGLGPNYASCFHDVTTGNNTWSESQSLFNAVPGYDLCSGWGTPIGSNLVDLLAPPDALQISPLAAWASVKGAIGPPTLASQNYTLTNTQNIALEWAAAASVPWLNLSINRGTLVPGGAAATVTASLNAAARNLPLGFYAATIWFTNLTDGFIQSRAASLAIIDSPTIPSQPASLSVIAGTTATFTGAAGGTLPLNCLWQYNGINVTNDGRVSFRQIQFDQNGVGQVTSVLTISNVEATDAGNYVMVVSNAAGVVFSSNAVLTVSPSGPVIIEQPASQTALVGTTVQFRVAAAGTSPFTYQWQQNGTNLMDGNAISGSLTPVLTILGVSSANIGTYTVVVSNALSETTSSEAILPLEVTVPGQELVRNGGFETGSFSSWSESGNFVDCSVSGNEIAVYSGNYGALLAPSGQLGYISQSLPTISGQLYLLSLWLDSPDGLAPNEFLVNWNGNVLFDETNVGATGWTSLQYYVMATASNTVLEFGFRDDNSFLGLDTIQVSPLVSADGPPIIAMQPANQAAAQGGTASFGILSSGRLPLSYQWQFAGANLLDATNAMLALSDLSTNQTGMYDVLVSNSLGSTISSNALLTVLPGSSELINFDDLLGSQRAVATGYQNMTWSNFFFLDALALDQSNGYTAGVVSVPKVAYNADGAPATMSASAPFAFLSAYLTAAWNDNLQLEVLGYNGDSLSYDNIYKLSATTPTLIAFNYVGVTSVQFISSDGTPHPGYNGSGAQFVMDDLTVIPSVLPAMPPPMTVLYSFGGLDGGLPSSALARGADGSFYGTTTYGGSNGYGTVFRMTTNGVVSTLCSFDNLNGAYPIGALSLGADGNFYGTTEYGGTNDYGTVFRLATNGTLTTLASFDMDVTGGYPAAAPLQGPDGSFYGTTTQGGTYNYGTVFRMTTNGALSALVTFDYANGAYPYAALTPGLDGKFYGTTEEGGALAQQGTVFSITTNGTFSILASFNYLVGALPYGGLVQGADGQLYGTTVIGGIYDFGTVFSVTTNGTISTLASFDDDITGAYPSATLALGADGNFYGTTSYGGAHNLGTVFRMTTNGALTSLASFDGASGMTTKASLVEGDDGSFYGTAPYGGVGYNGAANSGDGVIFRIGVVPATTAPAISAQPGSLNAPVQGAAIFRVNASGAAPLNYSWQRNGSPIAGATGACYSINNVQLHDSGSRFDCVVSNAYGVVTSTNATLSVFSASGPLSFFNGPNGGWPFSALVQGADGNFYGTTQYGGTNADGTVFRMTTNGALFTLASFDYYVTGGNPWGGLAQGTDGNFYGTTTSGGAGELGTVFRMTTNGAMVPLASFEYTNGAYPYAGLTLGADGNLYGTTYGGGGHGEGTIFRVTTNGAMSTLASIYGYPFGGLAQGADGSFYGTTVLGGSNSSGTVFRITTNGTLTTLFSFDSSNGTSPYAGLTLGADGNFYGTTYYGGTFGGGTVFRITIHGTLTNLFSFDGTNGLYPLASLTQGADGNFYGSTALGGTYGNGTVFSMTTNGILTRLLSFDGANGSSPGAALIQGIDGSFYGTSSYGGAGFDGLSSSGNGTVFRLVGAFTKGVPLIVTQPVSQTVAVGASLTFDVSISGAGPFTYQWQFDGANYLNPITSAIITTVAGNGALGYSGDGGAATNATLGNPYGVAVDSHGNVFIADTGNQRIREVGTNGIITTVAGNGALGYSGDGGAATNATLGNPYGVAVDAYGNVYIADTGNDRIREVGTNGVITTVAGNGTLGYSGDGGAATNATLGHPYGVAVDSHGNVFIADAGNQRIREVGTNGNIATVAGNGTLGYSGDGGAATNASINQPRSVAVDAFGNLFIADAGNNCIREVDTNGIIATVAGIGTVGYSGDGGSATEAELNNPTAVAVDGMGDIFMADSGNNCIREVDVSGVISTVAGNGTSAFSGDGTLAMEAELNDPVAVALDETGNAFIADSGNNRIREVVLQGPALVLTNVATNSAGSYDVVVSNAYGSITSCVATLMVGYPPVITSQPTSLMLMDGASATFSISATGTSPLFYQWQFNGVNLADNSSVAGSQSNVLTLTGVTSVDRGTYQVVVNNAYGLTNAIAVLEVQETPALAWIPIPIIYGSPLTTNQLNAMTTVPGSFAYDPTNGSVLDTGTNILSVLFTPADLVDFISVSDTVGLLVSPAPLTVTASNVSLPYGQVLPAFTGAITGVTNGDDITASYSCSVTNNSPPGTYPIVASLVDPDDRQTNYVVTLNNGTLTITMAVPSLTWTNPAALTYGSPLTTNQLNAVTTEPGSFAYNPTNGSILDAGTNILSVLFTPADPVDFSSVIDSVSIVVAPAPLSVTASNVSQPFGQVLPAFTGTLTGVTNGDDIAASYSCSATNNSPVGIYPIVAGLVDPDGRQTNYTVTLNNGTLTITGAPVLAWNPIPITYGISLSSNQLNAMTTVPGSFAYDPTNGSVLDAGTNVLSVLFTPSDTVDFSSVTDSVGLWVSPASLTVTASNVSLPYGHALPAFTGTLTGVTNGDDITASYSCSATNNSLPGTYPIVAGLVDPDDRQTNYAVALNNGTLTITMAIPSLTWTNPGALTYGSPLTTNQLNAVTTEPGSFAYNPTNGSVLDAGTNSLSVLFTPAALVDFSTVIDSVSIVVAPAPLSVTASNVSQPFGQVLPAFIGTLTGVTNGDDITASYSCSATNNSPVGTYPIVAGLVDPDDRQTNYVVTLNNGTLTITGAPVLTWIPLPLTYGSPLTTNQLNAMTTVPGSFTYNPTNGSVLDAGTNILSVLFTPADLVDFSSVIDTVGLMVSPAPLSVTASNVSLPYGQVLPAFTGAITGVTNGDDITVSYSCSATNDSPVGTYPIVAALVDPDDRQTNYAVTLNNGTLSVVAPPNIQSVRQSGSSFTFIWSATVNQTYQIQSKTNLTQSIWAAVGTTITATNSTMTSAESIGTNTQQFYRIVVLP